MQARAKLKRSLKRNANFFRQLAASDPKLVAQLLERATASQLHVLCSTCLSVRKKRLPLLPEQRRTLVREVKNVRRLSRVRSVPSARRLFLQTGGGVPVVLANILLPLLGDLVSQAIDHLSQP
jgi:hypothetical protein